MMESDLIRFIVYAASMGILYSVISFLNKRNTPSETDRQQYVVKMPDALKYVYFSMFLMGIILFVVFLFFRLKGNPSITSGNFWLALTVCFIGLYVMIMSTKWQIVIHHGMLEICRLFHKPEGIQIIDLDMAEVGNKSQLILFKEGKKLITIDVLCDNYDLLVEDLKKAGRL